MTGPTPDPVPTISSEPIFNFTSALDRVSPSPPEFSTLIVKFCTEKNSGISPKTFLTSNSNDASAPSYEYPLNTSRLKS